jgi:hypothetical protein
MNPLILAHLWRNRVIEVLRRHGILVITLVGGQPGSQDGKGRDARWQGASSLCVSGLKVFFVDPTLGTILVLPNLKVKCKVETWVGKAWREGEVRDRFLYLLITG